MREVLIALVIAVIVGSIINGWLQSPNPGPSTQPTNDSSSQGAPPQVPGQSVKAPSIASTSEKSFTQDVLQSRTPVLVDFFAAWCGPCKQMSPIVEEVAQAYSGKLITYRCDVDQNPSLAGYYQVTSIPTFIVFKDGKPVGGFSGGMPRKMFEAALKPLVK